MLQNILFHKMDNLLVYPKHSSELLSARDEQAIIALFHSVALFSSLNLILTGSRKRIVLLVAR